MSANDSALPWGELPGPPVAVEPLGGQSTGAWLATYTDGTQVVRKRAGTLGEAAAGRNLVVLIDAEELGPKVLSALGLRAAAVQRLGERDVRMEYVKGTRGSVYSHAGSGEAEAWVTDSNEGRLLGLADHVMANHDRHGGNWLFTADEELVGIDHGNAFTDDHACTSQFADALYEPSERERAQWTLADRNDFSPADMAEARHRLDALRPEFDRLGRGEWHDAMLRRLGEVEPHAAGTRRRIPAAGPREWPVTDFDTTAGPWPVADQDIPTQRTVPERTTDMTRSSDTPDSDTTARLSTVDLATAVGLVVQDYRAEMGPEVPAVAAVLGTREQLSDWDIDYMATDRLDIAPEVVAAMRMIRDADAADLAPLVGAPAAECGEVYHAGVTDEDEVNYGDLMSVESDRDVNDTGLSYEESVPERDPEPGSWIDRNLPRSAAREVADGFEPDIPDRDVDDLEQLRVDRAEDGAAPYTPVPDANAAMHSLTARYLHEGDRFAWRGEIFTADDSAIAHDGLVTVPLALSDGANGWVELPAEAMVPLHHDDLSEPRPADAVADSQRDVADIREAVATLPDGAITDADLDRAGVTPEEFGRLVDADMDREAEQWRREHRPADRSERAATAAAMTTGQARAIVERADELNRHLETCGADVGQCTTCSEHADDRHGPFWTDEVAAARDRLTDTETTADTDAAALPRSADGETDAVLDRIDAVLDEPDLPPWEEQVERCAQSVHAAAKAVHRVEDAGRAERIASWNAEDAATAADTSALADEGVLR